MDAKEIVSLSKTGIKNRVAAYCKQEQYASAIEVGVLWLRHNEPTTYLLSTLAQCYRKIGNEEAATQYLNILANLIGNNPSLLGELAVTERQRGNLDWSDFYTHAANTELKNELSQVDRLNGVPAKPDNRQLISLAAASVKQGDYKKARNCLNTLHQLHPEDPDILSNLAYVEMHENNFPKARDYLNKALARNPAHRIASCNMALLDLREGRTEAALQRLEAMNKDTLEKTSMRMLKTLASWGINTRNYNSMVTCMKKDGRIPAESAGKYYVNIVNRPPRHSTQTPLEMAVDQVDYELELLSRTSSPDARRGRV